VAGQQIWNEAFEKGRKEGKLLAMKERLEKQMRNNIVQKQLINENQ